MGILYLIWQTYLGDWINVGSFIKLEIRGGDIDMGEGAKKMRSLLLFILSFRYPRDISDF